MATRRKETATVDIKIRMREPLRAAIQRAAKRKDVSMNSEMVERLERSFEQDAEDERAVQIFGSPEVYGLVQAIGIAIRMAGENAQKATGSAEPLAWLSDPWSYQQACLAVIRILKALRPLGELTPPSGPAASHPMAAALLNAVGVGNANAVLDMIREADPEGDQRQRRGARMRKLLGAAAARADAEFDRAFTGRKADEEEGR